MLWLVCIIEGAVSVYCTLFLPVPVSRIDYLLSAYGCIEKMISQAACPVPGSELVPKSEARFQHQKAQKQQTRCHPVALE